MSSLQGRVGPGFKTQMRSTSTKREIPFASKTGANFAPRLNQDLHGQSDV